MKHPWQPTIRDAECPEAPQQHRLAPTNWWKEQRPTPKLEEEASGVSLEALCAKWETTVPGWERLKEEVQVISTELSPAPAEGRWRRGTSRQSLAENPVTSGRAGKGGTNEALNAGGFV